MSEHDWMLVRLGQALAQVARPHRRDEALPNEVQAILWQVGVPYSDRTPRQELVASLWARKRSLLAATRPEWGGPGLTPPSAA